MPLPPDALAQLVQLLLYLWAGLIIILIIID